MHRVMFHTGQKAFDIMGVDTFLLLAVASLSYFTVRHARNPLSYLFQ